MIPSIAGVKVRPMTRADLDQVIAIVQSLAEAPHWPRSSYFAVLDPEATPHRIALVVESPSPESIAGFVIASLVPPEAELETIAVAARFQRHGLAARLFESLAAELHTDGVNEVVLEVRASNQQALGFYRSLGFAETGRRPRYYIDPVEDAVLMRLEL